MTGSRDITSATATAAAASTIAPVLLAKLALDSGDILVHSWAGDLTFGGDTYLGMGRFGGIGAAEEASDLSRTPLTLTLSGIPNDVISVVLGEHYQGRRATIYLGYFDPATMILIDAPTILYRGNIDKADIQRGKDCYVALSVESRFSAWDTPKIRRYNNADQRSRYPDDRGLEFVAQAADKRVWWGQEVPK
jgi:hypothetical protein